MKDVEDTAQFGINILPEFERKNTVKPDYASPDPYESDTYTKLLLTQSDLEKKLYHQLYKADHTEMYRYFPHSQPLQKLEFIKKEKIQEKNILARYHSIETITSALGYDLKVPKINDYVFGENIFFKAAFLSLYTSGVLGASYLVFSKHFASAFLTWLATAAIGMTREGESEEITRKIERKERPIKKNAHLSGRNFRFSRNDVSQHLKKMLLDPNILFQEMNFREMNDLRANLTSKGKIREKENTACSLLISASIRVNNFVTQNADGFLRLLAVDEEIKKYEQEEKKKRDEISK